jgi:REP element-mobilizing transposase RayT
MHKNPVRLSPALRERVGRALVERLHELNVQVIAVSVSEDHVHMLAHLPVATTRKVVGLAKSRASFRVRDVIPRTLWGRRCKAKPIRDREHHVKTFNYILKHKRKGAWTWTFRDGPVS